MNSARSASGTASTGKRDRLGAALVVTGIGLAILGAPREAAADQGGISFWLPGVFGSLAATPLQPGWSLATLYYHASTNAGGDVAASRAIHLPNRTANLTVNLNATLEAKADIVALAPTYVFATPVLGGQFAMTVAAAYARAEANIDANIVGALGPIGFATERSVGDARWGSATCSFSRLCAGITVSTTTWSTGC